MVFEKIREIIADQLGIEVDEISMETKVKEDLSADSLDLFQIINEIEDEFDFKIEEIEEAFAAVKRGEVLKCVLTF